MRWTVEALAGHPDLDGLLIVTGPEDVGRAKEVLSGIPSVLGIVAGGASRQESVAIGLYALGGEADDLILVHDGARPLVSSEVIDRCLTCARARGNAVAALPVADTLKRVADDQTIAETVDRAGLWAVQTPQVFRASALFHAHARARAAGFSGTDEAFLIEQFGDEKVHLVPGAPSNLKVTLPEDLVLAEAILTRNVPPDAPRVGFGYDVHRFAPGRRLVLGGVEIPHFEGLLGHSDADVVLHALMDALLGAAALPDIGHLFPNTDPAYAGADSAALLAEVSQAVAAAGYKIINVDTTVIAEAPKIAPYVDVMRRVIADKLCIAPTQVGIKATTHEGLGALGAGLGIAAHAVASLAPR